MNYLVNNLRFPFCSNSYKKCNNNLCRVCCFSNVNKILSNKFDLPITIPCSSSCNSVNCIYILKCSKCNLYYIGQTTRTIYIRLSEHIKNILKVQKISHDFIKFNNFLLKTNHCQHLYKHFSSNHLLETDFSFQVFYSNHNF
jgi:hypothetical protein